MIPTRGRSSHTSSMLLRPVLVEPTSNQSSPVFGFDAKGRSPLLLFYLIKRMLIGLFFIHGFNFQESQQRRDHWRRVLWNHGRCSLASVISATTDDCID